MKPQDRARPRLTLATDADLLIRHRSFTQELFASGKNTRDYLLDPERTPDSDFLRLLAVWRRHKMEANEEFQTLPELLAIGQYDDVTHFVLELIQNGDDNEYSRNALPMLRMDFDN